MDNKQQQASLILTVLQLVSSSTTLDLCRQIPAARVVKDPKTSLPVLLAVTGVVTALIWWRKRGSTGGKGGKGESSASRSQFAFPGKKVRKPMQKQTCICLMTKPSNDGEASSCVSDHAIRVLLVTTSSHHASIIAM